MDSNSPLHTAKQLATTNEIVKMFRRRGYEVTGFSSSHGGYKSSIQGRYQGGSFQFHFDHFTLLQIQQEIDHTLGQGQEHVSHTCGHILLKGIGGETTQYHVYRNVQAGPQSRWIWECPGCHEKLQEDAIQPIED